MNTVLKINEKLKNKQKLNSLTKVYYCLSNPVFVSVRCICKQRERNSIYASNWFAILLARCWAMLDLFSNKQA